MPTLVMILKKEPYSVMVSGEKKYEYRDNSPYWTSRLFKKDGPPKEFEYIQFYKTITSHAHTETTEGCREP